MSIETRTSSALYKRAEQLKRWEESDTNREPVTPKHKSRKIKFSSGCVFLAACAAGEKDEVLRLLEKGADIDTANVDGLTALHQACIDDNLDMVEFLVEQGADVNRGDNEGWTPLHATASCGFQSIAKYLIDHGANVAAVNCDGELALDITDNERMEDLLKTEVESRGIDCEQARSEEERLMMKDANEWLLTKSALANGGSPKTGATALHVAAAKGYAKVIKILLQCGADLNKQDNDGWTPLHAASHWGQMEAAELLANNMADMNCQNLAGQTAFDVCDNEMLPHLNMLKKRQATEEASRVAKKRQDDRPPATEVESPTKVKKVEVKIEGDEDNTKDSEVGMDVSSSSDTDSETTDTESEAESDDSESEKKNKVNAMNNDTPVHIVNTKEPEPTKGPPSVPPKQPSPDNVNIDDNTPSWRRQNQRPNSFSKFSTDGEKDSSVELPVRRINSFQNDPDKSVKAESLDDGFEVTKATTSAPNITTNNTTTTTTTPSPTKTIASPLPNTVPIRSGLKLAIAENNPQSTSAFTATVTAVTTPTTPTTPTNGNRLTMIKNFFKSFVPPVRDEESETQRKAHAKRVRETRRSTQGVTLEEIKSAEQLVKMKNNNQSSTTNNNNNNNAELGGTNGDATSNAAATVTVTATITTAAPTVLTREPATTTAPSEEQAVTTTHERRPSWRLRVDNGSKIEGLVLLTLSLFLLYHPVLHILYLCTLLVLCDLI